MPVDIASASQTDTQIDAHQLDSIIDLTEPFSAVHLMGSNLSHEGWQLPSQNEKGLDSGGIKLHMRIPTFDHSGQRNTLAFVYSRPEK